MLRDIEFKNTYSSGLNEPKEFFSAALMESKTFDLGLGFFSSSGIRSLAYGFALFLAKGGKMRVVINHILCEADKDAIERGQNGAYINFEDEIIRNISKLRETLSRADEQFFSCFSYLISQKRIEFVATISSKGGLGHDKYGVFSDDRGNKVAFIGSANFSKSALESNGETITVFASGKDSDRIDEYVEMFNESWMKDTPHLKHIPLEKVETFIASNFGTRSLDDLLKAGVDLREEMNNTTDEKPLPDWLVERMERMETEPRFPFPTERTIQAEAYAAWIMNGKNGIFAMATGSGKTVTALNCLLKQYGENGYYKALIVVPTCALALQWENEARRFNFQNIVSTHSDKEWKNKLERYTTRSIFNQRKDIVIVTTYATLIRKQMQSFLAKTKGMDSFLFIADECHNLGAARPLKRLPVMIKNRIGLSATPERIYDEGGSNNLCEFFNSQPPHYTYRFTMKEAIDNGILCHYDYYPMFVSLTSEEMRQYNIKTEQLRKFIDPQTGKYKKEAEMLLMARKRIIHKAANKKTQVARLLDEQNRNGRLEYTFVFVPEGYEPDYAEIDDYDIDNEDIHIIDEYSQMFKERRYSYHQYITGLDDAQSVLDDFERGDIKILLSMKCLDEGIDIPRAQNAIFIASTGNPRQFIQRRGRVLRKCEGKKQAFIWDMIVVPPNIGNQMSTTDRNIFVNELKRVLNFAALADNKIDILYGELREISNELNIDMFGMLEEEEQQYE